MPTVEAHEYHVEEKETLELSHSKSRQTYLRKQQVGWRIDEF